MGTINYWTNKYITIGLNTNSFDDMDDFDRDYEIDFILEETRDFLEKYSFDFWDVSIEPGYYEGFYIKIENNWLYFDDSSERKDALKETTQLKRFLLDCVYCGLVVVYPGWCTSYQDKENSIKKIRAAIKNMKTDIKNKPTYRQMRR